MTRYALSRREPLLVELEAFAAYVGGDDGALVVTLEEGLEAVQDGRAGAGERRAMKAVVVALGQGRAAARGPHRAAPATRSSAATSTSASSTPSTPASRRSPTRRGWREALARTTGDGRLRATDRHRRRGGRRPGPGRARPATRRRRAGAPRWEVLDAVIEDVGRGLRPDTTVALETTVPVGTTRERVAPALAARSRLTAETDFHTVFSPERVYSGRVLADLDTYPKLVGGLSEAGEARGRELYAAFLPVEVRPMGVRGGRRALQARRDHLPRHQHRVRQRARPLRRRDRGGRRARDRRRQLAALQPHPPAGGRGGRPLHPRLPALPPGGRAGRAAARGRARGQRGDAGLRGGPARGRARHDGCCPRRRLPRRREGDGVLGRVRRCATSWLDAGRKVGGRRPAVRRRRAGRSLASRLGRERRSTLPIVQADHAEYAELGRRRPARGPGRRRRPRDSGPRRHLRACACSGWAGPSAPPASHRRAPRRLARPPARRRRAAGARSGGRRSSAASAASRSRSTRTFQPAATVSTHSVVSRMRHARHAGEVRLLLDAAGVGEHGAAPSSAAR